MVTTTAIDQLPSLPQVLLNILDAIQSDTADYQHMAEIIRQDAAVATRLIAVANSSFFGRPRQCDTIERALLFLGTDAVKTIVITASIKQFFGHFNQHHNGFLKQFWRRSLVSANFAQVLATLTSYSSPDEAYLAGLLIDVGQLIFLTSDEQQYLPLIATVNNDQELLAAEQQQYQQTHCQLSGQLVDSWNISGFLADAVRYHHEPLELVQDAQHLVKIINLASLLSADTDIDDHTLAAADALFGLNESLTRELASRISDDVDQLAQGLGIDINGDDSERAEQSHQQLGQRLGELGELAQINASLLRSQTQEALQSAIQRSLYLTFGIRKSVVFLLNAELDMLISQSSHKGELADFRVPASTGRSMLSSAFARGEPLISADVEQPLSVVDRQLASYCGGSTLVCWPLFPNGHKPIGILAFSVDDTSLQNLRNKTGLAQSLCKQIATAIANSGDRLLQLDEQDPTNLQFQNTIREAVHEASNPLSIIRNYLEMLNIKLGDEHEANEGLELIKQEIDRVGNILLRLKDPSLPEGDNSQLDINRVTSSIATIFQQSICSTRGVNLVLKLDKKMPEISGHAEHLKQILTNLLKNAVEAVGAGGQIELATEAAVSFSGKQYVGITIKDNGPGIPDAIKQNLFAPVTSTKGSSHSGLGLSIVKRLIDDMEGSIVCRSNAESGTEFQILLPN